MDLNTSRCWAEIDLNALQSNCRTLHALLPGECRLMHILKADAYGHGAVPCAQALAALFPDDWIGVACISEALELRHAGVKQEILILGYTPPEAAAVLAEERLTQTLLSPAYTAALADCAALAGVTVSCHLKLDTGMSRIGYLCYEDAFSAAVEDSAAAYSTPQLHVTGIFTHFSSSYGHTPEDEAYTKLQFDRFQAICLALRQRGISLGLRHCCNSPATVNSPAYALDLCRVGTVLYGLLPKSAMLRPIEFRPVLTWKARVAAVHTVASGTPISYSRQAVASGPMTLAVVTAGDADGYFRNLTNLGRVRIGGHVCSVVGRVCMDMFMVDVTGLSPVSPGDEVLLMGGEGDARIPCEWLYGPLGLGPSAVTCNLRNRVPRLYQKV